MNSNLNIILLFSGFCGVFIFSLWDRGNNDASIIRGGKGVNLDDFGGEGTGVKSMKFVDWRPPSMSKLLPYVVRWRDVALHIMHEKVCPFVFLLTNTF